MAASLRNLRADSHTIRFDRFLVGVVASVLAVTVGACGAAVGPSASRGDGPVVDPTTTNASGTTTLVRPPSASMSDALRAWANFPVNVTPRPLVFIDEPVKAPDGGFTTGDTKEAFVEGAFTAPPGLPSGPPDTDGYPIVDAQAALAVMRSEGLPPPSGGPAPVIVPLAITRVELGSAPFITDRGTRSFPVWMFSFDGAANPAKVLAVAPQYFFPIPQDARGRSGPGAQLAPDGRTLNLSFGGAAEGTGPCTADYTVDQTESATAVAIDVRETRAGNGQEVACNLVAYPRHASIVLDAPLGNRVLISGATKGAISTAP